MRLKQGDFERAKEYDADPVERARDWESQGAQAIHVVDLDGAEEGRPVQLELLRRIARAVGVPLQVGGESAPSKTCAPCGVQAPGAS